MCVCVHACVRACVHVWGAWVIVCKCSCHSITCDSIIHHICDVIGAKQDVRVFSDTQHTTFEWGIGVPSLALQASGLSSTRQNCKVRKEEG